MLQEPLKEGDVVGFSARLECLLSGLGLTLRVTLFTVAQQHVQQISHPPFPLPKPLHHHRELQEPVITDFSNHKENMTLLVPDYATKRGTCLHAYELRSEQLALTQIQT